jgi:hypothetical protein
MRLRVVQPHDSKHFRDQLFRRFGILLTASDMWDLRDQIRTAKVIKRKGYISTYLLRLKHQWMHVIYDSQKDWFVTAVKLNQIETMDVNLIQNSVIPK